ncbi:PREDICTED: nurim homolog [Vollenhovia emeryi]|uniref:nurim homolog n=1 Tax=Vollenhovia emeryi TaxID=411798 RepID=UPI0005F49EB7|nr:PREDICTED: nurim homolog [Vollenhovia emeryi]XP_011874506.1 PREDICTED: nurim homolog [Vollenhovia emeryi]XP_011874507.1 PREDICTED: nurim homolog [Vollenhovia emeryi]
MISHVPSVIVGASSFVYTCYILFRLTYFLSKDSYVDRESLHTLSDDDTAESTLWSLLVNMLLLTIFVFQHSIMANDFTKQTFCKLRIEHLSRSIYNACSSASLHFMISKWQQTPAATMWKFETSNHLFWLFSTVHSIAWVIIYSGCIMMDMAELCGLKQMWYRVTERDSPLDAKSRQLRRYMRHMRHPSFTGFLIILWICPIMSADRLLLAIILTLYMPLLWTIDSEDYNYHIRYFKQKQMELS